MKNSSRREFLEMAGTFAILGLMMTGCKTMDTLEKNIGGIMGATGSRVDSGKTGLIFKSAKAIKKNFTGLC